jgi:transposase
MSMPGIGIVTALTIIAEVDNFSRFSTPEKLTRYAGLVPRERKQELHLQEKCLVLCGKWSRTTNLIIEIFFLFQTLRK